MGGNGLASVSKMPLNGAKLLGGAKQVGQRELRLHITTDQAQNLKKLAGMFGWPSPVALAEKMLTNAIDSAASVEIMRHVLNVIANAWACGRFV